MATESVTNDQVIKAFAGNDSDIFLAQATAIADLLATCDPANCGPKTLKDASEAVHMLLQATRELILETREFGYEQDRLAKLGEQS
ncbi:MAG: hypothetical protein ABIQ36_04585 [Rhodanobacter sp.]